MNEILPMEINIDVSFEKKDNISQVSEKKYFMSTGS